LFQGPGGHGGPLMDEQAAALQRLAAQGGDPYAMSRQLEAMRAQGGFGPQAVADFVQQQQGLLAHLQQPGRGVAGGSPRRGTPAPNGWSALAYSPTAMTYGWCMGAATTDEARRRALEQAGTDATVLGEGNRQRYAIGSMPDGQTFWAATDMYGPAESDARRACGQATGDSSAFVIEVLVDPNGRGKWFVEPEPDTSAQLAVTPEAIRARRQTEAAKQYAWHQASQQRQAERDTWSTASAWRSFCLFLFWVGFIWILAAIGYASGHPGWFLGWPLLVTVGWLATPFVAHSLKKRYKPSWIP
jgi:hypothetical protein